MCQFQQFQAQSVPMPVLYNAESSASKRIANTVECVLSNFAVVMEDLKGYSILRAELIEGCVEIAAIQEVMSSIGAIHRQSLHNNLVAHLYESLYRKVQTELCKQN